MWYYSKVCVCLLTKVLCGSGGGGVIFMEHLQLSLPTVFRDGINIDTCNDLRMRKWETGSNNAELFATLSFFFLIIYLFNLKLNMHCAVCWLSLSFWLLWEASKSTKKHKHINFH